MSGLATWPAETPEAGLVDPTRGPYTADPTGLTDSTSALQAAFAFAMARGVAVKPPPGTYTVSDNIHGGITNQWLGFIAQIPGTVAIQRTTAKCIVEGRGARGVAVPLAADVAAGQVAFTVNALPANLAAGDDIELASNVISSGNAVVSELARVKSITGAGPYTINLYGPLEESYAVANAATVARLALGCAGSVIDGITFRQTAQNRDDAGYPLVRFALAKDFSLTRPVFRDADVPGLELRGVLNVDVMRPRIDNLTDNLGNNFIGYGMAVAGNSRDVRIENPVGRWCRHVLTTAWGSTYDGYQDVGGPRHLTVTNGQSWESSSGGWNTHKEGKFVRLINCESHNDKTYGFYIRAPHTTLVSPIVVNPGSPGNLVSGIAFFEGAATDGKLEGGRVILGPQSLNGVQTDSPRTTVTGTFVGGPGGNGANFKAEATATDSAWLGVRSKDPFGSVHIQIADGSGTNHLIDGGFFNSASSKSIVGVNGTAQARFAGAAKGTNLFAIAGFGTVYADNQTNVVTKSGNYTLGDVDGTVLVDCTGGARSITLPAASAVPNRTFVIKKKDASANAVTIVGTVDGAVNPTLAGQYATARVFSDGTSWWNA